MLKTVRLQSISNIQPPTDGFALFKNLQPELEVVGHVQLWCTRHLLMSTQPCCYLEDHPKMGSSQ